MSTSPESILQGRNEIVRRHGPWTAHNIHLGGDVYTIDRRIVGDELKLRRIVQVIADLSGRPLGQLRVLDLACLEGLYAIELARRGADVVAIEGREANIEKARFVKRLLALDRLELIQDDVRHVSRERHGQFDVVLCLGILYHLDAPDLFEFLERLADVCRGFAVIDTHVSVKDLERRTFRGRDYWGRSYVEHAAGATPEEKMAAAWASLDNPRSFWLTRPSLYNGLSHAGFTSVYECRTPAEPDKPADRVTLAAVKGRPVALESSPLLAASPVQEWSEAPVTSVHPSQQGAIGRIVNAFLRRCRS